MHKSKPDTRQRHGKQGTKAGKKRRKGTHGKAQRQQARQGTTAGRKGKKMNKGRQEKAQRQARIATMDNGRQEKAHRQEEKAQNQTQHIYNGTLEMAQMQARIRATAR